MRDRVRENDQLSYWFQIYLITSEKLLVNSTKILCIQIKWVQLILIKSLKYKLSIRAKVRTSQMAIGFTSGLKMVQETELSHLVLETENTEQPKWSSFMLLIPLSLNVCIRSDPPGRILLL